MDRCPLITLPDELHLRILHFAGWRNALKLGQTCRKFRELCEEPTFWQNIAKQSFQMRVNNFRKHDNWRDAFKALLTGRFYGWGQNWNLMFANDEQHIEQFHRFQRNCPWPTPLGYNNYRGIVDVQSGGWSVSFLTLSGLVVVAGALDGSLSCISRTPRVLRFPVPDTKIYQISCGRSHLLALSRKGEIWTIRGNRMLGVPAIVQFADFETVLNDVDRDNLSRGSVRKVVAGWNASGALIEGYGIAMWFDSDPDESISSSPCHVRTVSMRDIPYLSSANPNLESMKFCEEDPVEDFTIGELFVLAVTRSGRVFVAHICNVLEGIQVAPLELLNFKAPSGQPPINRVEGKFRRFGLFNRKGLVHLIDDASCLARANKAAADAAGHDSGKLEAMGTYAVTPQVIEELNKHHVVDVAFGDWHCLALTDEGKVLSWGTESQSCGSLGLGPREVAKKRGVKYQANRDGILEVPQIVSFHYPYAEKGDLSTGVREYAYKVSAAGWHSCALVATVMKDSTLSAEAIPQCVDGCPESKEAEPAPAKENSVPPALGEGQAEGKKAKGDQSIVGRPGHHGLAGPDIRTERGHRGGIVGMESEARGGTVGLAEGTMARGGSSSSFFGLDKKDEEQER
ncbi:regulator of chromosome condensation 1/beta-lactamase-inhibitor protein II [Sphaerosporella brunnea]|uniref:Regulator of chromosome condensation 1/beta-lactamase-inhibitor protein II n=1 Tax=Sphaerosporella brunnea TaxID=1250544 RepID=A0A5J5F7A0_9PEZI|nr:regulator of chromosome condensation 1/beta-lactamase-inhibitor protein II [Sphaerosporella brunnea]